MLPIVLYIYIVFPLNDTIILEAPLNSKRKKPPKSSDLGGKFINRDKP